MLMQFSKDSHYLTKEEEEALTERWCVGKDQKAGDQLVISHIRLVVKIAHTFRGYNVLMDDLISQGNVGLMEALKRFDRCREVRFATYAMWWIRASILELVIRNWSLVKIGTTNEQKILFFRLRAMKEKLGITTGMQLSDQQLDALAEVFKMPKDIILEMHNRMMVDSSLNSMVNTVNGEHEMQDLIEDGSLNPEEELLEVSERAYRMGLLTEAMKTLSDRERRVVEMRNFREPPATLEMLAQEFSISRERVRQIETTGLRKIYRLIRRNVSDALHRTNSVVHERMAEMSYA